MRLWLALAGFDGAIMVALGAYGAHAVAGDAQAMSWFDTATKYQAWHALALLGVAALADRLAGLPRRLLAVAGSLFVLGTLLFCGSLYSLALGGGRPFPMSAPLGGSAFILGWLALAGAGLMTARR